MEVRKNKDVLHKDIEQLAVEVVGHGTVSPSEKCGKESDFGHDHVLR